MTLSDKQAENYGVLNRDRDFCHHAVTKAQAWQTAGGSEQHASCSECSLRTRLYYDTNFGSCQGVLLVTLDNPEYFFTRYANMAPADFFMFFSSSTSPLDRRRIEVGTSCATFL